MPEENQKLGKSFGGLNIGGLRGWADSMVNFQTQARQEQINKSNADRETGLKNVYKSGISTTNHGVSQNCDKVFRIGLVAQGIRDYFAKPENGEIDYSNVEDVPLVDAYKAQNPDSEKAIWQFVLDDSQICDPNPLYQELGFYPPEESAAVESIENEEEERGGNFFVNVAKNYITPFFEHGGNAVANLINGGLEEIEQGTMFNPSETDYTMSALENYAQMNYGTNFYGLTEEQKNEAREAVSTEEGMDMYKPTVQRVISQGAEAGLDAFVALTAAPLMVVNAALEETEIGREVLGAFGTLAGYLGYLFNQLPLLKQFRDSLQTEEEKAEWDQYVAGFGLFKLFGKKANEKVKKGGNGIKDIAITAITDPKEVIESFKSLPKKTADALPDQGKMIAKINKLTPGETLKFKQDFGGETHGDFLNRVGIIEGDEGAIVKLQAYKTDLFNQITDALEEIGGEFDVNNPWMQEMIKENLRNAMEVMERDPTIVNKLSEISNKYFQEVKNPDGSTRIYGKLKASEIKFLMRYFAEKTRLGFNKENEPKKVQRNDNIYSQVLDDITRIAEENGFDNMREMSRDIQKSHFLINALGKDLAKKYGKSGLDAADVLALFGDIKSGGLKFVLKRIITSERAKKNYVKILNKMKGLTPERQWANLEKIREINSKNMFDKWVQEIEADSKTPKLGVDQQYSNNPVDYTSPTRVTPEGEAGRYGQTLETKKNTGLEEK